MSNPDLNRIKLVLVEKKRTNLWLSKEMSVSVSAVSRWATNTTQPSLENLFRIASVLGVNVRELLINTDPEKRGSNPFDR